MYLVKIITAVVATVTGVTASVLPVEKRASSGGGVCTSQYFEPVTTVGNKAGTPFCESKWGTSYLPVTTITAWSDSSYVYGIQVGYSDGSTSPVYGYNNGLASQTISVNYANDNFTTLNLYQTAGYPYLNALYITTHSGKIINPGESIYFFPTGYIQPVGSGILFGVSGTIDPANGYLYSLGFQFLNGTITSIQVKDFRFNGLPADDEDITPTTVDTATYVNKQSSSPQTWTFSGSNSTTVTYTFELQFMESFTPSEAIEVGYAGAVPGVTAMSTTTFSWTLGSVQSFSYAYATTDSFTWTESGTVQPGKAVSCIAAYGRGVGNFPFNSTITVNLLGGQSWSFVSNGILAVDDASNVEVECGDNND